MKCRNSLMWLCFERIRFSLSEWEHHLQTYFSILRLISLCFNLHAWCFGAGKCQCSVKKIKLLKTWRWNIKAPVLKERKILSCNIKLLSFNNLSVWMQRGFQHLTAHKYEGGESFANFFMWGKILDTRSMGHTRKAYPVFTVWKKTLHVLNPLSMGPLQDITSCSVRQVALLLLHTIHSRWQSSHLLQFCSFIFMM